tara:strand:+ start:730 stop:1014 length:285 start_codon:yes stop_codon:yes gene_type:complete
MRMYHARINGVHFISGNWGENARCIIENPDDFFTEYFEPLLNTILDGDENYEEAKEIVRLCLSAEVSGENDIEPSEEAQEFIEHLVNPGQGDFE